jgi:hypothetical protein
VRESLKVIDAQLSDEKTAKAMLDKFSSNPNSTLDTPESLSVLLQSVFNGFQNSGIRPEMKRFCDYLETDPETGKTAGAGGQSKLNGVDWVIDRWANWPDLANPYPDDDDNDDQSADISWLWQSCTEFGELCSYPSFVSFSSPATAVHCSASTHPDLIHLHRLLPSR